MLKREDFFNPHETYVPRYSQKVFYKVFCGTENFDRWIIYARLLQAHPYVQSYIARRQEGKCLYCGKKLFEDMNYNIVHHRDYLNLCGLHSTKKELIREPKPTRKKPNRTIPVPNCEYCKRHCTDDFNDCMCRLVILHDECYARLHLAEQKTSEWKPIKYVNRPDQLISRNPITTDMKRIRKKRICKKCGKKMVLRDGKFGLFFGCSTFPECNYTELV